MTMANHRPHFRLIDRLGLKVQIQFEPWDVWIGVFWRRTEVALHVLVCLVPLFPLHVTVARRKVEPTCDEANPCCDRYGEYNNVHDGALTFTCPKHCVCHD